MTRIKLCGISRMSDIEMVNHLKPEYIGFVFWRNSKRFISFDEARKLKKLVSKDIKVVGVFVDAEVEQIATLLNENTIDIAQLHGNEDEEYINTLRKLSDNQIIKAFRINNSHDIINVDSCNADYVLLDSGTGSGKTFDWELIKKIERPFFLAGGINIQNVNRAIDEIHPYAVDISSGIETDGIKNIEKMIAFVNAVRTLK